MRMRLGAVLGLATCITCAFAVRGHAAIGTANHMAAAGPSCDYACLTGVMDRYLKALVAHPPRKFRTRKW